MIVMKRIKSNKKRVHALLTVIPTSVRQVKKVKKTNKKIRKKLTKKSVKILQSLGYKLKQK